jgi:hypothetical protein
MQYRPVIVGTVRKPAVYHDPTASTHRNDPLPCSADCIKGGLGGPNAPCLTSNGNLGIWDRVLNWRNLTTQQSGQVTSDAAGAFVAHPGPGQVNVQILKPGGGAGMATGSVSFLTRAPRH